MDVSAVSCIDDDQVWPPGFRFHPTDEELVLYYLKRKICRKRLKLDIIREADIYKFDPEELPGQSILKTGDRLWFFFSPRGRKYPNGGRSSRATRHGYWKATGKDRNITYGSRNAGIKKTLVFYRGRAPKGERTDWVMHEYVLDDEELKMCQNIKDHYVLYKVYKKSGAGPKNGEQYGAPFNEEDWDDDEVKPINSGAIAKGLNGVNLSNANGTGVDGHLQFLEDFEEFLQQTENVPVLPQTQPAVNNYFLSQVFGGEEPHSALLDTTSRETMSPEPNRNLLSFEEQKLEYTNSDLQLSPTSNLESVEASEVTPSSNQTELTPVVFDQGFLEMDDLLGPESIISKIEKPVENLQFDELDGLGEMDFYHDAAMFVQDIEGSIGQGILSHEQSLVHGDGFMNQGNFSMQTQSNINFEDQAQFYPAVDEQSLQFQFGSTDNQLQYQSVADQNSLWMNDLFAGDFNPEASYAGTSSAPGLTSDVIPPQRDNNEVPGTSRISSALWSFVESIPTTPAAAAESPLVNRAFERMSSFNRLKLSIKSTNVLAAPAGNGAATVRRGAGASKRLFFVSVLGALCAILWVLIGSLRVLGRSIYA